MRGDFWCGARWAPHHSTKPLQSGPKRCNMRNMKTYKELTSEMTRRGRITLLLSIAIFIIAIIGLGLFFAAQNNVWPMNRSEDSVTVVDTKTQKDSDFVERAIESLVRKEKSQQAVDPKMLDATSSIQIPAPISQPAANPYDARNANSYLASTQEVKIALVIEQNEYDIDNLLRNACGDLYLVTARVNKPMVINNSMHALFGDRVIADFLPGNIIPSYHPYLTFSRATLDEAGKATIYLGGYFSETGCRQTLAIAQLTETALSFPTVSSVDIFLGTQKVN